MVFYRKYRPQRISELDLTLVREKLSSILSSDSLPHAFLFTGSKGLGKTSAARILAKAINCENNSKAKTQKSKVQVKSQKSREKLTISHESLAIESIEPCNVCENCVSITNGSNLDVLEIDAASNGGVEEIRVLRERVKFASSTLAKKVYIIDEVHMLSPGAFNALLKTLEEPPSHVVFILATTELHKLPATVISRTFQVQFEKPTVEEVVSSLTRIVEGEGLKVEKGVLEDIFTLADGSFRDGAKILEELVLAAPDKKITKELVEKVFKTKSIQDEVYELIKAMANRDAKLSLQTVSKLSQNGADFKAVIERFVDHLRGILLIRNNIKSEEKDVPSLRTIDVKELLELANEAYGELRLSVIPQLPLELMIVKFCIIDAEEKIVGKTGIENITEEKKIERVEVKVVEKKDTTQNARRESFTTDLLHKLFDIVNVYNKPAAALLRSCLSAEVIDNKLVITTPFPMHAKMLKSERAYKDIEKAVGELAIEVTNIDIKVLSN